MSTFIFEPKIVRPLMSCGIIKQVVINVYNLQDNKKDWNADKYPMIAEIAPGTGYAFAYPQPDGTSTLISREFMEPIEARLLQAYLKSPTSDIAENIAAIARVAKKPRGQEDFFDFSDIKRLCALLGDYTVAGTDVVVSGGIDYLRATVAFLWSQGFVSVAQSLDNSTGEPITRLVLRDNYCESVEAILTLMDNMVAWLRQADAVDTPVTDLAPLRGIYSPLVRRPMMSTKLDPWCFDLRMQNLLQVLSAYSEGVTGPDRVYEPEGKDKLVEIYHLFKTFIDNFWHTCPRASAALYSEEGVQLRMLCATVLYGWTPANVKAVVAAVHSESILGAGSRRESWFTGGPESALSPEQDIQLWVAKLGVACDMSRSRFSSQLPIAQLAKTAAEEHHLPHLEYGHLPRFACFGVKIKGDQISHIYEVSDIHPFDESDGLLLLDVYNYIRGEASPQTLDRRYLGAIVLEMLCELGAPLRRIYNCALMNSKMMEFVRANLLNPTGSDPWFDVTFVRAMPTRGDILHRWAYTQTKVMPDLWKRKGQVNSALLIDPPLTRTSRVVQLAGFNHLRLTLPTVLTQSADGKVKRVPLWFQELALTWKGGASKREFQASARFSYNQNDGSYIDIMEAD